jgi:hypothetical protein
MLWRLGRFAEITFLWEVFAAQVVEVGLVPTFVCLECRNWSRNWLCIWGSSYASGFQFLYRATNRDCDFAGLWVGLWNSRKFQCFVFAVIVALVFQRGSVPFGLFWLSSITYLMELL